MSLNGRPRFTVAVVSDYATGQGQSWENFRKTLRALAGQASRDDTEFLLVEREGYLPSPPPDIVAILPSLRVISSPETESFGLKNAGVREARGEIVVILDADCEPAEDWLSNIARAWDRNPDAWAISGHTSYEDPRLLVRLAALLARAYVNPGQAGQTRHASNNNYSWRRDAWLRAPLPLGMGPFGGEMQSEAAHRQNGKLIYDPSIEVVHEFEGWRMEADIRKNSGYCTVMTRLRDAEMPWAGLVRAGMVAIPVIVAAKTFNSWANFFRCRKYFRIGLAAAPVALLMAPVVSLLEVPGMLAAYTGRGRGITEFR